jgi:DNA-binding HxlR family transcriptional regulator
MVASKSKAHKPTPLPGRPVRGSRTGRPEMALLDLLGRRWAMRLLWELRDGPVRTFRDLQACCGGISSSVLNDRVRELRDAGIVTARADGGYGLTDEGAKLLEALAPLGLWAKRWARRTRTGP